MQPLPSFRTASQRLATVLFIVCFAAITVLPADAQSRRGGISLIRDAEIEALLADYTLPLMRAAGLKKGSVSINIVNDEAFNAFVSGSGLYIHTGLLLQAETPNEVIGVIAHEIGHIVGGHQIRLRERIDQMARLAKVGALLGVGIGVAGAATGNSQVGSAGFGIAGGSANIAMRDILRYKRDEEQTADRTAVRLLEATKQSGRGMLETFRRFARASNILAGRIDPYVQSHPTPNDRIARLQTVIEQSPYFGRTDSAALQLRHDMARAKIAAYVGGSRYAQALLNDPELNPTAALYGRAIVTHLYGSPAKAIPLIDQVLNVQPDNAYVHEMKGEIYLRSGNAKAAVAPFRRAASLDKTGAGYIQIELGHALLESGGDANAQEAATNLRKGLLKDDTALRGFQYLARAEAALGNEAGALLASAEFAVRTEKKGQAREYAKRAQQFYKRGSPGWLRAQDIIEAR